MEKKPTSECEYFYDGKCTGIEVDLARARADIECKNNLKSACCYTCHLRQDCGISCDFKETEQKVVQVDCEVKKLSSEQLVDIPYRVALDVYEISGLVLTTFSLVVILFLSAYPHFDYFGNIRVGFLFLERAPPDVKSRIIGELFLLLSPFLILILGLFLVAYSRVKKMQKRK